MKKHLSFIVPTAMLVDRLRDGLAANELRATVTHPTPDFIKVIPGKDQPWSTVNAYVKGFIAGFQS